MLMNELLNEDLGTLQQLNVGPLINVLKQGGGYHSKGRGGRSHEHTGEIGGKFAGQTIQNTSVVTAPIALKSGEGFKSLRKAFLDAGKGEYTPEAFALYVDDQAIAFGMFNYDDLRGSSKAGLFAYDLTPLADAINQADDEAHAARPKYYHNDGQPRSPSDISSYHEKERYRGYHDDKEKVLTPQRFQGKTITTNQLGTFITKIEGILTKTGGKLTAKLVMADKKAGAKRMSRFSYKEVKDAGEDLKKRLSIYKNSKKPTVDTIVKFIAYSLAHPGKRVQFAGRTYQLTAETYDKIDPIALLRGQSFNTRYKSADPGSYESLTLTYRFDQPTNQLIPVKAEWSDNTNPAKAKKQEAVLDAKGYVKSILGNKVLDKDTVVKSLLEKMKTTQYTSVMNLSKALIDIGYDWPELNTIYNSAKNEADSGRGY
jgi:hypothetical protein